MSDTMKRMWTDRQIRSMADESAKIRIEAGLTENAKPIYLHTININTDNFSGAYARMSCHILNNDPTAFTKSTLLNEVKKGRILVSGAYYTSSLYLAAPFIFASADDVYLSGVDTNGVVHTSANNQIDFGEMLLSSQSTLADSVIKIN